MSRAIDSVLVVGLGKVGTLVATLLHESGFRVTGLDNSEHSGLPFSTRVGSVSDTELLNDSLRQHQAVVSCLPYHLNIGVARGAHAAGIHYFDLTEDVPTTNATIALSATAKGVMAPQCGLAPGFIGIVGASLCKRFDKLRSVQLRVGALPQHPSGLLGYAFNWSPEGVVNEYLNDCEVVMEGRRRMIPAMTQLEVVVIDGIRLEAFATSGGLGTMCETFDGRVEELNYKTLRYRGHCDLMRFFFHELHMKNNREEAGRILVNAKPPVGQDIVYVYAAVEGWQAGKLFREEFVEAYYPMKIAGQEWRAISWTTAASVTAVVEMVADGTLPKQGFIKQEEIDFEKFLATRNGQLYAKSGTLSAKRST